MKKADKDAIVAAGRKELAVWLTAAANHGTIYYTIPTVARSGMSRTITLHTIVNGEPSFLSRLWPKIDWEEKSGAAGRAEYSEALDIVAKDWGFSFDKRAFVVGGCGMDMVFWLVDHLASKVNLDPKGSYDNYANRVRREAI